MLGNQIHSLPLLSIPISSVSDVYHFIRMDQLSGLILIITVEKLQSFIPYAAYREIWIDGMVAGKNRLIIYLCRRYLVSVTYNGEDKIMNEANNGSDAILGYDKRMIHFSQHTPQGYRITLWTEKLDPIDEIRHQTTRSLCTSDMSRTFLMYKYQPIMPETGTTIWTIDTNGEQVDDVVKITNRYNLWRISWRNGRYFLQYVREKEEFIDRSEYTIRCSDRRVYCIYPADDYVIFTGQCYGDGYQLLL